MFSGNNSSSRNFNDKIKSEIKNVSDLVKFRQIVRNFPSNEIKSQDIKIIFKAALLLLKNANNPLGIKYIVQKFPDNLNKEDAIAAKYQVAKYAKTHQNTRLILGLLQNLIESKEIEDMKDTDLYNSDYEGMISHTDDK